MNWQTVLGDELKRLAPAQVCALDALAHATAKALLPQTFVRICSAGLPLETPANVAIIMAALHDLTAAQACALLAHVRNFVAPCILVVANERVPLDKLAFLAMGYEALGRDDTENTAIYRYDLATYKQVPDWLNARYWAHPERWEP